jgi:hypothetical protein
VWRVLLLLVAVLLCTGCDRGGEVRELTHWTLVAPSGDRRPAALPARFAAEDMDADSRVVLETRVEVPAAWEGRPLALAVALFPGELALDASGRRIPPRELAFAYSWPLTEAAHAGEALDLRLVVDGRMNHSLMVAPRLSPTVDGDAGFASIATFNVVSSIAGTGIVVFVTALYLALFWFDRRRACCWW